MKTVKNKIINCWNRLSTELRTVLICITIALFFTIFYEKPPTIEKFSIALLENICIISSIAIIPVFINVLHNIKEKDYCTAKKRFLYFIFALICASPYILYLTGNGTTQIGGFFEKKEYTEKYIVAVSEYKNGKQTVYYLPAQISKNIDYKTETDYNYITGEKEDKEITYSMYCLDCLYLTNGEIIEFEENNILKLDEKVKVTDHNDIDYYITLTDEKAIK